MEAKQMKGSLMWNEIDKLHPRPLLGSSYSEATQQLRANETLVLKAEIITWGVFASRKAIAYFIRNYEGFQQARQQIEASAGTIDGLYAIETDTLLGALCSTGRD
jgi:hypothetical protein